MTLELIIWEAKQRPSTLQESRRPSTTVDEHGCVIVKGFVVPSRNSSFDSIAASSASSYETPGTPCSPIEEPTPGYSRPSGSLYEAPEMRCLKDQFSRSLHRPTRSLGSIEYGIRPERPNLGVRRSTWQQTPCARFSDDELLSSKCKFSSIFKSNTEEQDPTVSSTRLASGAALRISKTDASKQRSVASKSANLPGRNNGSPPHPSKCEPARIAAAASAIAVDSEDDNEYDPGHGPGVGGITAQRLRPTYADRRALSDQRAAQRQHNSQSTDEETLLPKVSFALIPHLESAIESDEDDEEERPSSKADERVARALDLAKIHRSRNSVTAAVPESQDSSIVREGYTEMESRRASASRAKFVAPTKQHSTSKISIEFAASTANPMVPRSPLRPSRSQPPPVRGVLKNCRSQPLWSETQAAEVSVDTARRGSAPIITTLNKMSCAGGQSIS